MPHLQSRPPTRIHSSRPVTTSEAHDLLSTYLASAASKPHLHPNADLTTDGPQFSTHGPSGGVIMNLLRRVEKGLRGEILAPEPKAWGFEDAGSDEDMAPSVPETPLSKRGAARKRKQSQIAAAVEWEDPEEYRLEQDNEEVEMDADDERNNVVGLVDDVPDVLEDDDVAVPAGLAMRAKKQKPEKSARDKKQRKAEKKARQKEEKKDRAAKRKKTEEG